MERERKAGPFFNHGQICGGVSPEEPCTDPWVNFVGQHEYFHDHNAQKKAK